MAYNFRNINYSRMLYESLRNYFSVNDEGQLSMLYKILLCFIQQLQPGFDAYDTFRRKEALIAQCKYVIGQLTNVLNILYDATQKRIFITQAVTSNLSAPGFAYTTNVQARGFNEPAQVQGRGFFDSANTTLTTIHVPVGTDIVDLTATVEQIRLKGLEYTIETF